MVQPITRRQALQLGALGAVGVVGGGAGLSQTLPWGRPGAGTADVLGGAARTVTSVPLSEPGVLRSEDGRLRVDLVVARHEVEVAGARARLLTYNGTVPGPTWRVHPGDRLDVRLVNQLDSPTNLHTHGLHVSPQGNGDNALLSIEPGEAFDYRFDLPQDHPAGVFWYHPHHHGLVADQLFGGLYGTILVEDEDIPVSRERVLVISDISLNDGDVAAASMPELMMGREGDLLMVNGQLEPQISARPGERERWRVVNACTSRYLRLALPGQQLRLLGIDSGHAAGPREVDEVLLAPGNRADVLVTMRTGTSTLRSLGHHRGASMMGMMQSGADRSGPATLATLTVAGTHPPAPGPVPQRPADRDLRDGEPTTRREITFTMGMSAGMGMMGMSGGMAMGGMVWTVPG